MGFTNNISKGLFEDQDEVEQFIKQIRSRDSCYNVKDREDMLEDSLPISEVFGEFDGVHMLGCSLDEDHLPDTDFKEYNDDHQAHKFVKVDEEIINQIMNDADDLFGERYDESVRAGNESATGLVGELVFAYLADMSSLNVKILEDNNVYAGDFSIEVSGEEYSIEVKTSGKNPYDLSTRCRDVDVSDNLLHQMQHNGLISDVKVSMVVDRDAYDDGWLVGFNYFIPTVEVLVDADEFHEYTKNYGDKSVAVYHSINYFDQVYNWSDWDSILTQDKIITHE